MNIQQFDHSVDLLRCLLWQYNEAQALQTLVQKKQDWYDEAHAEFWANWYTDVFDLRTANEFGLAVWAIILGVPLVVLPEAQAAKPIFGFGPDATGNVNFTNGNFVASTASHALSVEQRRLVLRLRYFQLTTRGAIPEVNAFLAEVFGPGQVYVTVTGPMTVYYKFAVAPSSAVQLVLGEFDILPRPAGVTATFGT